jgi:hypothetical protein
MLRAILFFSLCSNPLSFFVGYLPLPSPKPEDCIIVPLDNPKPSQVVELNLIVRI